MNTTLKVVLFQMLCILFHCDAIAQDRGKWFEEASSSVVLLEKITAMNGDTIKSTAPHGTGFLVWNYKGENGNPPILVTNKHVLSDLDMLLIRFRVRETKETKFAILRLKGENGKVMWVGHKNPKIDVAAITVDVSGKGTLMLFAYSFFDEKSDFKETADVIYFGFPLGFKFDQALHTPIARKGMVALNIGNDDSPFLIDALVFPGSSGSPVFLAPTISPDVGILSPRGPALIGILSESIYSYEEASSPKGILKLSVAANSGLAIAYPASTIKETIELIK